MNNSQIPGSSQLELFNKAPGKTCVYGCCMGGDEKKIVAPVWFLWENSWNFINGALMSSRCIVMADLCLWNLRIIV